MNIKFEGEYKSIKNFKWNNIPSLAILTGLNGSGKSQLLELIGSAYQSLAYSNVENLTYKGNTFEMELKDIEVKKIGSLTWQARGGQFPFEHYNFSFNDLEEIVKMILGILNPPSAISIKANNDQENESYVAQHRGINRVRHLIEQKKSKLILELIQRTGKKTIRYSWRRYSIQSS